MTRRNSLSASSLHALLEKEWKLENDIKLRKFNSYFKLRKGFPVFLSLVAMRPPFLALDMFTSPLPFLSRSSPWYGRRFTEPFISEISFLPLDVSVDPLLAFLIKPFIIGLSRTDCMWSRFSLYYWPRGYLKNCLQGRDQSTSPSDQIAVSKVLRVR